jgi:opacity protein-like surface antigen
MKKSVCAFAILAVAVSTAAVAEDIKQDQKANAAAVSATQMTDSEMDKVTAGFNAGQWPTPDGHGANGLSKLKANPEGRGGFVLFNYGQCKGIPTC